MPEFEYVAAKFKLEDIPSCGTVLKSQDGWYWEETRWRNRSANEPDQYVDGVCGWEVARPNLHRRCERCMRAVGAIW